MLEAATVRRLLATVLVALTGALVGASVSAQEASGAGGEEPLTLEAALRVALSGPDMALAALRVRIAHEDFTAATAPLSGEVRAGASRAWTPTGATTSAPFGLSLTLNVVQLGPTHERALRAANALELAQVEEQDAWARTQTSVTRAYLAAVRAKEEAAILEAQGSLASINLRALRRQLALDAALPADVRAAELEVYRAETDLLAARQAVAAALDTLGLLLGKPVLDVDDDGYRPLPALRTAGATAEPGGLDADALDLSSRADVTAARIRAVDAELDLAAAQRAAAPRASLAVDGRVAGTGGQLDLGLGFDTASLQPRLNATLDPLASLPTDQSRLALRVDVAVPLGGASGAATAAATARLAIARQQFALSVMQAELDVSAKLRVLDLSGRRLEQAQLALASSEEAAAEMLARFQLGLVTAERVRAAELGTDRARLELGRAQDAHLLAHLELERAVGARVAGWPAVEGP